MKLLLTESILSGDEEPSTATRKLRGLAAWYRAYAEQAGNPAIWATRLRTAEDLEAEASRIEQRQANRRHGLMTCDAG